MRKAGKWLRQLSIWEIGLFWKNFHLKFPSSKTDRWRNMQLHQPPSSTANKQRAMCFPPPPLFTERHLDVVEEWCPTVCFIRLWPCARHNLSYPPTHPANTRTKIRFQCLPDALNLNGYISSASFWASRLYAGCEHWFNDILQTPTPSECYTSIHCIRILLKSARPS